jgi:hypothetical protein
MNDMPLQPDEIERIVKWVGEIDPTVVMHKGRMLYMMSYWKRADNEMARRHVQECLREIVRLRAELDNLAGRAIAAITEPPMGKPDIVCHASKENQ